MYLFMGNGTSRKEPWTFGHASMYLFMTDGTLREEAWICLYVFIYVGCTLVHAEKEPGYSSMYLFMGDRTPRKEAWIFLFVFFVGDGTRRIEAWIFLYVFIYGRWYTLNRSLDIPLCTFFWMVRGEKKPGSPSMYFFLDGKGQEEAWIIGYPSMYLFSGW